MTIKEAFEQLSATVKKGMKNPFFVMRNLSEKFEEIANNIEGGGGSGSTVEVTQVISSGTKIATITVDDTPTDLYAPAGGSGLNFSTTEQVIGTWIDGKPLYMRVFDLGSDLVVAFNEFTSTSIDATQMKVIVDAWGIYSTGETKYSLMATKSNTIIRLQAERNGASANVQYIILMYTKTSD